MPVTIEQAKHWTRPYRGVGCIVTDDIRGWVYTVCGSFQTGTSTTKRPPKLCRKCRANLKNFSLTPSK